MSSEEGTFFEIPDAWTCEYCLYPNGHTERCAVCERRKGPAAAPARPASSNMSSNDADELLRLFKENQDDWSAADDHETPGRPVKGGTTVPSDSPTEVTIYSNSFDSPPSGEGIEVTIRNSFDSPPTGEDISNWVQQQSLHLHAFAQDSAGNANKPTEVTIDSQTPFRKGTAPVAAAPAAVALPPVPTGEDNSPSRVTNDSQPNKPFEINKDELEKAKKEAKEKENVILLGFGNISQKHYNEFLDKYTKPWKEAKAKNTRAQVLKDIHQELDKYTVVVKKIKSDEIWVHPVGCERGPMVNDRVISSLDTKVKKRGGSTTSSRGQFKKTKKAPSLKQSNEKRWWMWIPGSGWIPIPDGTCGKVASVWERVQRDYRRCERNSFFVPFPYVNHNHNITKPGQYFEQGFQLQFFEACLSNPHSPSPWGVLSSTQGPVFVSEIYYGGEDPETEMIQIFGSNQNHDNRKNPPDNHNGGGHSRDTSHGDATQMGFTNTGDANVLGQSDANEERRNGGDHFTHACDLSSLSDTSLESSASSCAGLDELLTHIISDLDARIDGEIEKDVSDLPSTILETTETAEESVFDQKSSTHSKDSGVPVRGNARRRLDTGPIAIVAKKIRLGGNEPKEQDARIDCDREKDVSDLPSTILETTETAEESVFDQKSSTHSKDSSVPAVLMDPRALEFASDELRSDKNLVMSAVSKDGISLCSVAENFKNDRDVVTDAFALRCRSDKDLVLAAVQTGGISVLKCSPPWLRDDEYFFKSLFEEHGVPGRAIQYASERLRSKKELVTSAVSKDGISLKHAAKNLKNDRDVVRAAVMQNWKAFKHVLHIVTRDGMALRDFANEFKDDKDVVLAAVKTSGEAIKYASQRLQHDKDVVLAALRQNGNLLESLPEKFRFDKDVVLAAVKTSGEAIKHASQRLQRDKDVVLAALRQNGNLLESVSESFRFDRDCVLEAISSRPGALGFAQGELFQDQGCLIKAGIWDAEYGTHRQKRKIVLSTRFSLAAESSPTATEFTVLLKRHPYFQNSAMGFQVYSPNAFNKQTCDPNWTDMEWKCRGTKETCQMEDRSLCEGPPRAECCWRYSYRCHLAEAKASRGFMIQVVELDCSDSRSRYEMGKGQAIERVMAEQVGIKVFVVYEPCFLQCGGAFGYFPSRFCEEDIDPVAKHVEEWYANGCVDMGTCLIPGMIGGNGQNNMQMDMLQGMGGGMDSSMNSMSQNAGNMMMKGDNSKYQDRLVAQKKKVIRQQQQRLLLLRHASKCKEGPNCKTKFCAQMTTLWKHMKKCRDKNCKTPHCLSSRCVLNHYQICKSQGRTATCEVCGPVMEQIKRQEQEGSLDSNDPLAAKPDSDLPNQPSTSSTQSANVQFWPGKWKPAE